MPFYLQRQKHRVKVLQYVFYVSILTKGPLMRSVLFFIIAILTALPARAEVDITRKIHYGSNNAQIVDVYQPDQCRNTKCPVVMWVHGGGWKNGDTSGKQSTELQTVWANQGIVMVGVNYRLSPEVMHPGHVEDVAAAINWVHDNIGKFGGDNNRISLLGHSAGAHLVALVTTNPRFLAKYGLNPGRDIRNVFPVDTASFDLTKTTFLVGRRVRQAFGSDPEVLRDASPIYQVVEGGSYPAFILSAVSTRDDSVETNRTLQQKLQAIGANAEFMIVDFSGHKGWPLAHGQIAVDLKDLDKDLTKKLLRRVLENR